VKQLCLYHHAPTRTDDQQGAILVQYKDLVQRSGDPFEVIAAYEGLEVTLGDDA